MATAQYWVDWAMIDYGIDAVQYPPTMQTRNLNTIYHRIWDFIVDRIWEGIFWDILTVEDTVVGQNEYSLPTIPTWPFLSANKIENISIKYADNEDFVQAKQINRETITEDLSTLSRNYSTANPVYFIADNSYFIFPAPTTAIADGIKVYWIKALRDITLTTDETEMFWGKIPTKYFDYITLGLEQYILRKKGKIDEANNSHDRFERVLLPELIGKLGKRKIGISLRQPLNVSKYYGK